MRFLFCVLILGLGVASARADQTLNFAPGTYRDFADYELSVDPEIMKDATAAGGDADDAHCVAEKIGRRVHGADYAILSDAVSGKKPMTEQDHARVEQQQNQFMAYMQSNQAEGRRLLDDIWKACLAS